MPADAPIGPPGLPPRLTRRVVEVARREWPNARPGLERAVEGFLADNGVAVGDLSAGRPVYRPRPGAPVGAALLLSGELPAGARPRRSSASPAARVPAAVAVVYAEQQQPVAAAPAAAGIGRWRGSWTDDEHAAAVAVVREAIARGDVYQANVVAHRSAAFTGDPAAVSALLGAVRRTPYSGSLSGDGWSVHSASPECLLEVTSGRVLTRPIKGTAPRGADTDADAAARAELLASGKDRAEHVMIVDLERNDLARVCRTGSVTVPSLYDVRPLAGVWHAESTVVGDLRSGVGLADLLAATFPGGSVTGAPKIAAIDLVDRIEPVGRGPSMGALGWIDADGTVRLGLTIRTFAVCDGEIHLWTGGGITWGSEPAAEVAEAHAKAAPLLGALAPLGG